MRPIVSKEGLIIGTVAPRKCHRERIHTEMKAVLSMAISGTISMSCWHAIISSSCGVTESRRGAGRAILRALLGEIVVEQEKAERWPTRSLTDT